MEGKLRSDFNKNLFLFATLIPPLPLSTTMSNHLPAELCKQAEETRRIREAHNKEDREKEVLLQAVEEEERREAEEKKCEEKEER